MSLSPLLVQYLSIKDRYDNKTILMFRVGDFYEMFFDDAVTASKVLDITLTGKDCGLEERAPMCGVPYHALDKYVSVLVKNGYKVAICEQAGTANSKTLMQREIIRIVTPGTVVDNDELLGDSNNFLACVYLGDNDAAVVWTDVSTGELYHEFISAPISVKLNELLLKISPSEIICNSKMMQESLELSVVKFGSVSLFQEYDDAKFDFDVALKTIKAQLHSDSAADLEKNAECVCACGAMLSYLTETQKRTLSYINKTSSYESEKFLSIDASSQRTLELTTAQSGKTAHTLFGTLNNLSTKMGAIQLKSWLSKPSADSAEINSRLNAVESLFSDTITRDSFTKCLDGIADISRLATRLSYGSITPKECLTLGRSLARLPELKRLVTIVNAPYLSEESVKIKDFKDLSELIISAIKDNSDRDTEKIASGVSSIFNDGYNEQLDEYRHIMTSSNDIIAALVATEKELTGINTLKIKYNRIIGYFIEIPHSDMGDIPYRYERKHSTATADRFTTADLKEAENKILNAASLVTQLEAELYENFKTVLKDYADDIIQAARAVGRIDCIVSFAIAAKKNNYVKPVINENIMHISIKEGRHPVAEHIISGEQFVPNDAYINDDDASVMLITGPNMAGKSLFMRQVALITVMAHMGSFVPARSAEISIVDKIFTRVGASDDMSSGRSTFMVEMSEVANILNQATDSSLVILDEIGRGTATYDGLSIAWAVMDYLTQRVHPKVLFSTHFHELTELENVLRGVKNYKLTVKELNGSIVFLRKVMRGSANKSFGIEVASLAGVKKEVLERAKVLLKDLERADVTKQSKTSLQLSMFGDGTANEIISILQDLDIDDTTPKAAFEILSDLKEKAEKLR